MKKSIFYLFVILLCVSCFQFRKETNDFIDAAANERSVDTRQSADCRIVIGGYATSELLSKADSVNSVSIVIASDRHADFTGIEQMRNLQRLSIALTEAGDIDFTPLNMLKKLQMLRIGGRYFNEIPNLSGIPSLTHLEISAANLTSLNGIEKIPNLERLEARDNRQLVDTSALRHTGHLKYLLLFNDNGITMSDFSGLTNLEELLISVYREHDLTGIGALQSLKTLYVGGTISERTNERNPYEEIGKLTGLTKLKIDAALPSIDFLAKNVNLETLTLIADQERDDFWQTDLRIDFTPLKNLKKLRYLRIRGFMPNSDFVVDEMPQLEYFNMERYDHE